MNEANKNVLSLWKIYVLVMLDISKSFDLLHIRLVIIVQSKVVQILNLVQTNDICKCSVSAHLIYFE